MANKTTSTTNLQNIPTSVIVEISDGSETETATKVENSSDRMESSVSRFIQSLSPDAQKNVTLLRKLQRELIDLEVKFYNERHVLDMKYESLYVPLFEARRDIITGETELKNTVEGAEGNVVSNDNTNSNVKGVDRFWLIVFLNSNTLSKEIYPGDSVVLQYLKDVRRRYNPEGSMNFVLEFHFEPNDYFTNTVLTKEYDLKATVDEDDPYSYEGPRIVKCRGCTINWKKGKDVTVKTIRRKKLKGPAVIKTVKRKSFFNFFNPPAVPDDSAIDEEIEEKLMDDFEIGEYIRNRIIPRAYLYYTKEIYSESEGSEGEASNDSSDASEESASKQHKRK